MLAYGLDMRRRDCSSVEDCGNAGLNSAGSVEVEIMLCTSVVCHVWGCLAQVDILTE